MSLDITLYTPMCAHCGRSGEGYSANITHNLGAMAEAAGIYLALWRPEEIGIKWPSAPEQAGVAPLDKPLGPLQKARAARARMADERAERSRLADTAPEHRSRLMRFETGRVYIVEAIGSQRVKIGWTAGYVIDRLRQLRAGCPFPLRVALVVPNAFLDDERALHEKYKRLRVPQTREWFRFTGALRAAVEAGQP